MKNYFYYFLKLLFFKLLNKISKKKNLYFDKRYWLRLFKINLEKNSKMTDLHLLIDF